MAKGLLVAAACGLVAVDGVRYARMKGVDGVHSKMLSGVPVLNYDRAYGGKPSLAQSTTLQNWMVMAEKGTSDEELKQVCEMSKCIASGHPNRGGVAFFEIRSTEEELANVLKASKGFAKFVEPDSKVEAIPELPGSAAAKSWGLDRVGVSLAPNTGSGAHIFVLDTGVRVTHTDFGGRAIPTADYTIGRPDPVCMGEANCASDIQGHGTHCAGSAAGTTYGVAPGATIYGIKVLGDDGRGDFGFIVGALDYVAAGDTKPAVASMSLGGQGVVPAIEATVDAATEAGVVVVVAGGNSNADACGFSPAYVPSAITVGSTDPSDARSSFSNYGACTDIWAPGRDIVSAIHTNDNGARPLSGTSMACPHVAGGAALLLTALGRSARAGDVVDQLLAGGTKNAISGLKSGDTNVMLYVGAGGPPPTPVPPPTPALPEICQGDTCSGILKCLFNSKCRVCPSCD